MDASPARGERLADGINVATRPARVRINYRSDIAANMRVLVGRNTRDESGNIVWQTDRLAQIVTVPAEIGFREALEFMIEDYSSAGNGS
jgi:head-tail adaptor